jgi:putative transposase
MLSNFPKIVKQLLKNLPQNDYPKLSTFLFVSCWLSYVLDQGQTSMRSLFQRLNMRGIDINIFQSQ